MLARKTIRVLVADDHEIVRYGIVQALEQSEDIEVVAEASNGEDTIYKFRQHRPDVTVVDLTMPGIDGLQAITEIKRLDPNARIMVLTMHIDENLVTRSLQVGATGYMLKNSPREEIVEGIRKVYRGNKAINDHIYRALGEKLAKSVAPSPPSSEESEKLTKREQEILALIVDGMTSQQIAEQLFISPRTVDTHRANMMQKLKVNNTAMLVRLAFDKGLVAKG